MQRLLRSAKFWTLVLDAVVGGATFFIGKYAGASSQDMLMLIGLMQPVVLFVIGSICVEDAAQKLGARQPR